MQSTDRIDPATSPRDYDAFGALIRDYVAWFLARHALEAEFAGQVFGHQALDAELRALATTYGPPNGLVLLARRGDVVCGGGAYRRLTDDCCEMKRLFLPEQFRGQGIGRAIGAALVEAARAEGYRVMRLDTSTQLTEAIAMYRAMGFCACPAYRDYPAQLRAHLLFMELPLAQPETR